MHPITGKSSELLKAELCAVVIAFGVGQEEESEDGSLGCPDVTNDSQFYYFCHFQLLSLKSFYVHMFAYFNCPRLLQVVLTNQKSLGVCSHVGLFDISGGI